MSKAQRIPTTTGHPKAIWFLFAAAVGLVGAGALAGGLLATRTGVQAAEFDPPARAVRVDAKAEAPRCPQCGVVVSVEALRQAGEASGAGAVAGGVIGGLVGNQFGKGDGRKAMTVIGAVGGGLAGHEIEKDQRSRTVYRTRVKMDDGSSRTLTRSQPLAIGQRLRLDGQSVQLLEADGRRA